MGAASVKANLIQLLMDMMEEVIFEIFLDINESYEALDHVHCLNILTSYGVGLWEPCLLRRYWCRLYVVKRNGG